MEAIYKIWKKYNEIQSTQNKMGLNTRKMKKILHPLPLMQEKDFLSFSNGIMCYKVNITGVI